MNDLNDLDYFVVQAAFGDNAIELSFMEDAFTTENVAVMQTIAINVLDDPALARSAHAVQELMNEMIVRGYQLLRDAQ
jgi:hypothetical protein